MDKNILLGLLPAFRNRQILIEKKQSVHDIIKEVLAAHEIFKSDYDKIGLKFWEGNAAQTAKVLWIFLKNNVAYKIEGEAWQTTKSPAAILQMGFGDCKHYAGFIGGVLDAINRKLNRGINWRYRFASYNGDKTPEHVFIVVKENGREYWIDPVLKNFNEKMQPTNIIDKKIKMALTRISGVEDLGQDQEITYLVSDVLETSQDDPQLYNAIQLLLKYGVMDANAKVNDGLLMDYQKTNPAIFQSLYDARVLIQNNAIGGLFSTIWRGVKKITLALPRAAYLSLVAINAFGYATKLKRAVYNLDGTFTTVKDKLKDIWQNKLGGDWAVLQNTINNGAKKKAILGVAPAIPAWVATSAAVVAAIMPLVNAFLKNLPKQQQQTDLFIDPTTGQPYGSPQDSGGAMDFVKNNSILIVGGLAAFYFLTKKRTA